MRCGDAVVTTTPTPYSAWRVELTDADLDYVVCALKLLPSRGRLGCVLEEALLVDAELIRGKEGVFDVRVDGKLIFSKHELGRFPEPDEVERKVERLKAGKG